MKHFLTRLLGIKTPEPVVLRIPWYDVDESAEQAKPLAILLTSRDWREYIVPFLRARLAKVDVMLRTEQSLEKLRTLQGYAKAYEELLGAPKSHDDHLRNILDHQYNLGEEIPTPSNRHF